ncbi:MAG TPA: DUF4956 domain-containing protein [Kofleriaceae bacterium]|nr:DUF4956 domain-containing protein [Kofleriaceae bacterium]
MKPNALDLQADLHPADSLDGLLHHWRDFGSAWLLADMLQVLALALVLGAAIAYHPATRRRMSTLEHVEEPKTILTYAMVAAIVALMVEVQPAMAFVVFGIGGLMRFRTDAGDAKDTGRVILVTVVGLCCGLKIFVVAVPATVMGWGLIWFLERQRTGIIRISGVHEASLHESVRAYRGAIAALGCRIIGEQIRFTRREVTFVVEAPPELGKDALHGRLDEVPAELRGVIELEQL